MHVTDTPIEKLKIGTPLVMGKYGVRNDSQQPVVWLKGTPNGDFITRDVVDFLPFDAMERENMENEQARYMGNARYSVCNLLQFLNSEDESWFAPMHQYDTPPSGRNLDWSSGRYEEHFGFLHFFEEYETASLKQNVQIVDGYSVVSMVRLPAVADLIGANRFRLFAKKGIRPRASDDMIVGKPGLGFDDTTYVQFWTSDMNEFNGYATFISRSASVSGSYPKVNYGVRPVCTISPETVVTFCDDGLYYIKPFVVEQNVSTDEELFAFLGLAQP